MRRLFIAAAVSPGLIGFCASACLGEFVDNVPDYSEGSFATVSGDVYVHTDAAVGKPSDIVGANTFFAGALTPFNSHYETDQLVAIGQGGSITLDFKTPMAVTGTPQIGIFTNAAFLDQDYPNGSTAPVATTDAMDEYGAERTAVVEVASSPNDFHSLGRQVFDDPTNYYANATGPFDLPPDSPQLASFDKPFKSKPSDFDGDDFAGVKARLNGSAGGTWLSVPTTIGLTDVRYVRLSDPMWKLPDGTLVDERDSAYYPPPDTFTKPADLFVDGAVLDHPIGGDANADGAVDSTDFTLMAANFGMQSDSQWLDGDFNFDGVVNALDFNILATNYGPAGEALGSLAPEPGSLLVFSVAGLGALIRQRRRVAR